MGRNIKYLIDRKDENYVFRLHNDRVYYVRYILMKMKLILQILLKSSSFPKQKRDHHEKGNKHGPR